MYWHQLYPVLATLLPTREDSKHVASIAGLITTVALDGKPINIWFDIVQEAHNHNKVQVLIDIVRKTYGYKPGDNEDLDRAEKACQNPSWKLREESASVSPRAASTAKQHEPTKQVKPNSFGEQLFEQLEHNYTRQWQIPNNETHNAETTECFNQLDLKRLIRKPTRSMKIFELSGPSGIGKTHVLKSLTNEDSENCKEQKTSEQKGERWKYIWAKPSNSFDQIMREFIEGIESSYQPSSFSATDLAKCLKGMPGPEQTNRIMFIIDDVDKITDDDILIHLAGDNGPAGEVVYNSVSDIIKDIILRLVLVTKRPRLTKALLKQHGEVGGVKVLSMALLDYESVYDMVDFYIHQNKGGWVRVPDITVSKIAQLVYNISGGHPGAISTILSRLAKEQWETNNKTFNAEHLHVVLRFVEHDITGILHQREFFLFNVLSVFRYFGIAIIGHLLSAGLLPTNLLPEVANLSAIQNDGLIDKHIANYLEDVRTTTSLIQNDTKSHKKFVVHPMLQHVLPIALELFSPGYLRQLHQHAFVIYDSTLRIRGDEGSLMCSPDTRADYTMEALYHYVQEWLASSKMKDMSDDKERQLYELATEYRELYDTAYQQAYGSASRSGSTSVLMERSPNELFQQWVNDYGLRTKIKQLPNGEIIHATLVDIFQQV